MRLGYPEFFLLYAGALAFHDLRWSIGIATASCAFAFLRFALEVQAKKEKKEELESTAQLLNEQAEELGQALTKLFSSLKSDVNKTKTKKYDGPLH